jgi:hypothetical protein
MALMSFLVQAPGVTNFTAMVVMNLVTPKADPWLELLFNQPVSGHIFFSR